jgi:hypothetical protein
LNSSPFLLTHTDNKIYYCSELSFLDGGGEGGRGKNKTKRKEKKKGKKQKGTIVVVSDWKR